MPRSTFTWFANIVVGAFRLLAAIVYRAGTRYGIRIFFGTKNSPPPKKIKKLRALDYTYELQPHERRYYPDYGHLYSLLCIHAETKGVPSNMTHKRREGRPALFCAHNNTTRAWSSPDR